MGIEEEAFKSKLVCVKAQDLDNLGASNTACGRGSVKEVIADWEIGVSTVLLEVEKMAGRCGDGITVLQVSGIHGGRLSPYTVIISVEK